MEFEREFGFEEVLDYYRAFVKFTRSLYTPLQREDVSNIVKELFPQEFYPENVARTIINTCNGALDFASFIRALGAVASNGFASDRPTSGKRKLKVQELVSAIQLFASLDDNRDGKVEGALKWHLSRSGVDVSSLPDSVTFEQFITHMSRTAGLHSAPPFQHTPGSGPVGPASYPPHPQQHIHPVAHPQNSPMNYSPHQSPHFAPNNNMQPGQYSPHVQHHQQPPYHPPQQQQQQQQQQQGPQLSLLDSTQLLKLFNLADRDKSGMLTPEELLPIVQAVVKPGVVVTPQHSQMLLTMLDKDGDGAITIDEFLEGARKFNWNTEVLSNMVSAPVRDEGLGDMEIQFSELKLGQKLGEGTFGVVYKAEWRGSPVALKVLKTTNITPFALNEFRKELRILSRLRHPNIVLLMAACTAPPNLCFVTEFLAGGSIFDAIHSKKLAIDMSIYRKLARDIAQGMNYLHMSNIIHRDLKTLNLLLDQYNNVKICDFGLSKMRTGENVMTKKIGTPIWMAPEILRGDDNYDEKVDVYAYGIILWELGTQQLPYAGMDEIQIGVGVVTKGLRPTIPAHWPPLLKDLIQSCWHQEPKQRPGFQQILSTLDGWK